MPDQSEEKVLTCVDCGAEFSFSARDQAFYQERGFQPPRRCKTCRDKRKSSKSAAPVMTGGVIAHGAEAGVSGGADAGAQREHHKVTCTSCGAETTVPFKPDPSRPVYCRTCYLNKRNTPQ